MRPYWTIWDMKVAEGVGFEPTIPGGIPVFKTGAFVRSAIPPQGMYYCITESDLLQGWWGGGYGIEVPASSSDIG